MKQDRPESTGISFNQLPDPDYNYTIQIDTPQPLNSSPRQGIDPRAVQYEKYTPVHDFGLFSHHNVHSYPFFSFNSDETIHLSQMQSPSSPGALYEQGIPSSRGNPSIFPCLEPPVSLSHGSSESVFGESPMNRLRRASSHERSFALQSSSDFSENQSSPSPAQKNIYYFGLGLGNSSRCSSRGTPRSQSLERFPEKDFPFKSPNSISITSGETKIVKKKRGRPRKNPLPTGAAAVTPTQLPSASTSKPARGIHTPKTPRNTIQFSPTPVRKRSGGCWTCKCRRKKCDEARPICSTCEKLGFPCLGYSTERPSCLSTPEKSEQTRHELTAFTKERREMKNRLRKEGQESPSSVIDSEFSLPSLRHLLSSFNDENQPQRS